MSNPSKQAGEPEIVRPALADYERTMADAYATYDLTVARAYVDATATAGLAWRKTQQTAWAKLERHE